MTVRAIFYVEEISMKPAGNDDTGHVGVAKLRAAAKGPYQKWSQYTPYGSLEIGTLNPSALAWFQERLGSDVAISFDDPIDADLVD